MTQTNPIRIYIACLASYNNGILHGCWIDALSGLDAIQEQIKSMLDASPIDGAEEYALHDYEGFAGVHLSEYQGIQSIIEIATFIQDHDDLGAKLIDHFGDLDEARTALEECYAGTYRSASDFAQKLAEDTTEIPSSLAYYIDYEAMARDMMISDIYAIETSMDEVHVFWSR